MLRVQSEGTGKGIDLAALGYGCLAYFGIGMLGGLAMALLSAAYGPFLTREALLAAAMSLPFRLLMLLSNLALGYAVAAKARHSPLLNVTLFALVLFAMGLWGLRQQKPENVTPYSVSLVLMVPLMLLGGWWATKRNR